MGLKRGKISQIIVHQAQKILLSPTKTVWISSRLSVWKSKSVKYSAIRWLDSPAALFSCRWRRTLEVKVGGGGGGGVYQTSRNTPNHTWLANRGVLITADSFLCKPGNCIFSTSVHLQYHRLVLLKPMGIYFWHRMQGSNINSPHLFPLLVSCSVNDDTPLRGGLLFLSTCFFKETYFLNSGRRHQPTI